MQKIIERTVNAERMEDIIAVFGSFDENIRRIEEAFNVTIVNRGTDLKITGDEEAADKAVRTLEGLLALASKGEAIDEQRVRYLMTLVRADNDAQAAWKTLLPMRIVVRVLSKRSVIHSTRFARLFPLSARVRIRTLLTAA